MQRDLVTIGRIVRPQGRKGEVVTEILSDRPDRFASLRRAYVTGPSAEPREVVVTSCWPHKGRMVVKLEGVDSIDAAEEFRGAELGIAAEDLPPLPEGSYYHHELQGLEVQDTEGRPLGTVAEILETGGAPVLVIRSSGKEALVPLAYEFVKRVDRQGRTLVVAVPEWVDADD